MNSGNEAGLHFSPTTPPLCTLSTTHLFCQFSKRCLCGMGSDGSLSLLRGLLASARTIWDIFACFFKYFFCDLSSDKVYQSPQTGLTPDMVRHSISQCTILSLDTPISYTAFHNAQLRHTSELLRMNNSNGWHLHGL